jgi:GNAT-family acetyltransferase (TIGR03103 family)
MPHHEKALHNLENSPSLKSWGDPVDLPRSDISIDCGWGHLVFGHTFKDNKTLAQSLQKEDKGARNLALYIREPQVVLAQAPQELFIDPSYTFRLQLQSYQPLREHQGPFSIRLLNVKNDLGVINRIYQACHMVPVSKDFLLDTYKGQFIKYWVAEDHDSEDILAVCMGIDHARAFDDPENGSSMWAVAVDPQAKPAGLGLQMVQHVAQFFKDEGRQFMDVSVLHDNKKAIDLYRKLGFEQIPVFCIKRKNAINENLFTGPHDDNGLNVYSMIIINEARRRGIRVDVLDAEGNYFRLSSGGTSVVCRESLTELTSSIAMSRCSDKATTMRLLKQSGLKVPAQHMASSPADNQAFLKQYKRIVVKPAVGEQGAGITVDVTTSNEMETAIDHARHVCQDVLLEEMVPGQDLRIIVINGRVVAGALRKPPSVIGDGQHTILQLVQKQSRRRAQATQGESRIPVDDELRRTVHNAGFTLDDILPMGHRLTVRKAANLHMGGMIHDVTDALHSDLIEAAKKAALALDIPVTGLDFIVPSPSGPDYAIIEANERPGLANHEPQPTAERFIDFLFPQSIERTL